MPNIEDFGYLEQSCDDCGTIRKLNLATALRSTSICGFCTIRRGLEDYQSWCGWMDVDYDEESVDEYLDTTSYGSSLPEWIQVRVKEWAIQRSVSA